MRSISAIDWADQADHLMFDARPPQGAALPGGVGVVGYGEYVVVDLAAHVFIDADQKHKLTARVENLFDEEYRTSVGRSAPSAGNDTTPAFVFGFRGAPQTLHVSYSYAF